jgi:hypothetical protein
MQGEAANHRKVRRSRAVVLSVAETAQGMRQVWVKKASGSEPLMTCRKKLDGIEKGIVGVSRDEPGGCLRAAQVVSGMEAARSYTDREVYGRPTDMPIGGGDSLHLHVIFIVPTVLPRDP